SLTLHPRLPRSASSTVMTIPPSPRAIPLLPALSISSPSGSTSPPPHSRTYLLIRSLRVQPVTSEGFYKILRVTNDEEINAALAVLKEIIQVPEYDLRDFVLLSSNISQLFAH